jgi:hypothetical protein
MKLIALCLIMLCGLAPAGAASSVEMPMIRPDHPRLGFRPEGTPGARTFATVRELYRSDETFRSYFLPAQAEAEKEAAEPPYDPLLQAACWVATGEERFAQAAMTGLLETELKTTAQSSYYSPVWQFALAYDWLFNHPEMTPERRARIEAKIADVLEQEVAHLDGGYSVVWHGRTQMANNSLVAALALSVGPRAGSLQRRALEHYADAMRALALAEGWPEGTGYWIHNRAFPFALASDCYRTATGADRVGDTDIPSVIRTIGLWQLYSLAPDLSFARYGDCWEDGLRVGPGLWQPVVDYYARITGDPDAIAVSDFFRVQSKRHYHAGRYGWSAVLAYDPALPMPEGYDAAKPEQYLNAHLPHSRLFGRHTLGEAFLTDGWGDPNAPWIAFKAGDVMAHHGHYDQGSFMVYRGSPLAVKSGRYVDYFGDYRLGYFTQTVAANSLLIHAPGEFGGFSRAAGNYDAVTGGQRPVMPTGSHIVSTDDWLNNLYRGRHYAAAEILTFDSGEGFDYLAADLTRAYNSTLYAEPGDPAKVAEVSRRFLYLREPQAIVVLDRVVTTDPAYRVQWLLHTPAKPETPAERPVEGTSDDGILTTADRWLRVAYENGELFQQAILPEQGQILKIGGPHYRHWVEGPQGGVNLEPAGEHHEEPNSYGLWRVQIEAPVGATEHVLLNVLWPRPTGAPAPAPARLVAQGEGRTVLAVGDWVVVLVDPGRRAGPFSYTAPEGTRQHLVVGLPGRSGWSVTSPEGEVAMAASVEGSLSFAGGAGEVSLGFRPEDGKGGFQ